MTTLLILAVLVLGVMAVIRLSRLYELTANLRGKREEAISDRDNRMNSRFMIIFLVLYFGFFLWLTLAYKDKLLPVAASEHGVWTDQLLDVNWIILLIAFIITNVLLFVFAAKYYHRPDRKAYYYPHNNKWELAWTVVPSVVLIGIIIYGLTIWNRITTAAAPGTPEMELYAKQFDWTARYPGVDGRLGATDYRLINDNNPLGIVTPESIAQRMSELKADVESSKAKLQAERELLPADQVHGLEEHIEHVERMAARLTNLKTLMDQDITARGDASPYKHGADDIVVKEFHLPVHEEIDILIRSRDIIHSAYLPHLRAQMNAVPGMTTHMRLTPTITTDSMRLVTSNAAFDYILMCNKICGASHYNMQMTLVVEPDEAYKAWLAQQKGFQTAAPEAAKPAAAVNDSTATTTSDTLKAAIVDSSATAMNQQKN